MVQQASALTRELDGRPGVLLAYLLGEYTSAERHESSVSSRLFVLEPEDPGLIASWAARGRAHVKLKDVAALLMGEQLERAMAKQAGVIVGICSRLLRSAVAKLGRSCSSSSSRPRVSRLFLRCRAAIQTHLVDRATSDCSTQLPT